MYLHAISKFSIISNKIDFFFVVFRVNLRTLFFFIAIFFSVQYLKKRHFIPIFINICFFFNTQLSLPSNNKSSVTAYDTCYETPHSATKQRMEHVVSSLRWREKSCQALLPRIKQ